MLKASIGKPESDPSRPQQTAASGDSKPPMSRARSVVKGSRPVLSSPVVNVSHEEPAEIDTTKTNSKKSSFDSAVRQNEQTMADSELASNMKTSRKRWWWK